MKSSRLTTPRIFCALFLIYLVPPVLVYLATNVFAIARFPFSDCNLVGCYNPSLIVFDTWIWLFPLVVLSGLVLGVTYDLLNEGVPTKDKKTLLITLAFWLGLVFSSFTILTKNGLTANPMNVNLVSFPISVTFYWIATKKKSTLDRNV